MKNKIYYILLSLLITFTMISEVHATDFSFTMSTSVTSNEVVVGEKSTIKVALTSNSAVGSCTFNIEADNTLVLDSKNGLNNWNFDNNTDGSEKYILDNSLNDAIAYPDGKNIFSLTYVINGNGKVAIRNIECVTAYPEGVDENGEEVELKATTADLEISFTTKEAVTDKTLSNVIVSGGTLSPSFSSSNKTYTIELDNTNFSLNLEASNPEYQDKIVVTDTNGNELDPINMVFKDNNGQNMMQFFVKIDDTTYDFLAYYENKELDNTLKSLTINGQSILETEKLNYEISIPNDIKSIKVEAVLNDSDNFEFDGGGDGTWIYNVNDDATVITLVIKPKNEESGGSRKEYTIIIKKEGGSSSTVKPTSKPSSSSTSSSISNPNTSDILIFIMSFILISSLICSVFLYQKSMNSWKQ